MDPSGTDLIEKMVMLRKEAPSQISAIYARKSQYFLKKFSNTNIQLHKDDLDFTFPDENFEDVNKTQCETFSSKLHEQIQLLNILINMKSNPISIRIEQI